MTKELRFTSLQSIRPSTDRILLTLCHIPGLSSKATSPKKPSSILPAKKKKKSPTLHSSPLVLPSLIYFDSCYYCVL